MVGNRAQGFNVVIEQLTLSVVALVARLRGEGSAVEFEIKLTCPLRKPAAALDIALKVTVEVDAEFLLDLGASGDSSLHTAAVFEHIAGRSAAAVSVTEGAKIFTVEILL